MKNYALLVLLHLLLSVNIVYSQINEHTEYNTYFLNGEYAMRDKKNYGQAITYFDSASLVFSHFHKPYFEVVICASKLNDYEKAYQYAVKMILTGSHFNITQAVLGEFCNTDYYRQLKAQEDSLYQVGMQKRDTAFANAVLRLCHKNQSIGLRKDTTTFYEFVALCSEKKAFPSYLNVGAEAYREALALLHNSYWHSNYPDSEHWQRLLELMHHEFISGGIEAYILPQYEDAYCRNNNLPLRYGILSNEISAHDIYPSIEELNKNRKSAGLASIELEAMLLNIDLNHLLRKIND